MHFSSDINRPPYEAQDAYLQITSGCSHGKCGFCTFYKDSPFQLSPMEIKADLKELKGIRMGILIGSICREPIHLFVNMKILCKLLN